MQISAKTDDIARNWNLSDSDLRQNDIKYAVAGFFEAKLLSMTLKDTVIWLILAFVRMTLLAQWEH